MNHCLKVKPPDGKSTIAIDPLTLNNICVTLLSWNCIRNLVTCTNISWGPQSLIPFASFLSQNRGCLRIYRRVRAPVFMKPLLLDFGRSELLRLTSASCQACRLCLHPARPRLGNGTQSGLTPAHRSVSVLSFCCHSSAWECGKPFHFKQYGVLTFPVPACKTHVCLRKWPLHLLPFSQVSTSHWLSNTSRGGGLPRAATIRNFILCHSCSIDLNSFLCLLLRFQFKEIF